MCQHDAKPADTGRTGAALEHGDAHQQDHSSWSRRDFLVTGAMAAGASLFLGSTPIKAFQRHPLMAMLRGIETDRILVIIQLNGGNDGLNTVIPLTDDTYYRQRPGIGIRSSDAFVLNPDVGLNPGLRPLEALWKEGQMNILRNVGYPDPNLSHFRATDIWVSGSDSTIVEPTGWLGRFLDMEYPDYSQSKTKSPVAVQIGSNLSLLFQGPDSGMGMNINSPELFERLASSGKAYDADNVPSTSYGTEMAWLRNLANQSYTFSGSISTAAKGGKNEVTYPSNNALATNLAIAARLIKGNLGAKIYMVSLGGFDTHANQLTAHQTLMTNLANAIKAFYDDLGLKQLKDNVTTMTFSEFGRRVNQNGSAGTDHGTSAPLFVIGGGVKGGFTGAAPSLTNLDTAGNLKFETDYRQVYATLMRDWFGVKDAQVKEVFGKEFKTLNLIKQPITTGLGEDPSLPGTFVLRQNYPNPFNPITRISYTLNRSDQVRLAVYDTNGRLVRVLVDQLQASGQHEVWFDGEGLASGVYIYTLQIPGHQRTLKMTLLK